jgi:hypothetical protein
MKRLLMGSLAILALAAAFHLGATTGRSGYVDHASTGAIAMYSGSADPMVLDEHGGVWRIDMPSGWQLQATLPPLPVPVSEIKLWSRNAFITFDDHAWGVADGEWVDLGAWPGASSTTEDSSWGKIKAEYR